MHCPRHHFNRTLYFGVLYNDRNGLARLVHVLSIYIIEESYHLTYIRVKLIVVCSNNNHSLTPLTRSIIMCASRPLFSNASNGSTGSKKMYVLRQGSKSLSVTHGESPYVIGFKCSTMARKVHYNLHPDPTRHARIERSRAIDVTSELKQGLKEHNINFACESVNIDTQATLFIPKHLSGGPLDPTNDTGVHLSTIDATDFMMYPFEHHVGIIMPYALLEERAHEYLFWSHLIEPCSDYESFLRALNLGNLGKKQN